MSAVTTTMFTITTAL